MPILNNLLVKPIIIQKFYVKSQKDIVKTNKQFYSKILQ